MLNVNLNGIDTLMLDFDGANTAVLTAPGVTTVTHTGVATGITQLTGDVTAGPGSGSVVATLSNTSTARSHLGLGTMATQNANAVDIIGGTIDGTAIGSTTASTVAATAVTATGNIATTTGSLVAGVPGTRCYFGFDHVNSRMAFAGDGITGGGEVFGTAGSVIWDWDNSGNLSAPGFHGTTVGIDNPQNYPANSSNLQSTSGTLYIDSTGPNTSTFGAFNLRGIHANLAGSPAFETFLSSDTVGNWSTLGQMTTKSIVLTPSGGGSITFQDSTTQSTAAVSPTLQTNGTNNTVQNKLNLVAGSNVTLTADGSGDVTIASTGGSSFPKTIDHLTSATVETGTFTYTNTTAGSGLFRLSVNLSLTSASGSSGGSAEVSATASYTDYTGVGGAIFANGNLTVPATGVNAAVFGSIPFYSNGSSVSVTFGVVLSGGATGTTYVINSLTLEQLA